jgi:hypothetical protein
MNCEDVRVENMDATEEAQRRSSQRLLTSSQNQDKSYKFLEKEIELLKKRVLMDPKSQIIEV